MKLNAELSRIKRSAKGILKHLRKKGVFGRKHKEFAYPYRVVPHHEVGGDPGQYRNLTLVGENWTVHPEKPVALAVGFNDWKLGFVSAYMPEYRLAFARRKATTAETISAMKKSGCKALLIWGYNEPSRLVMVYARRMGIEVTRMEDAFIRSVDLGGNHSTPYSLAIDGPSLFFDCSQPSRLETILAQDVRIATDSGLLEAARRHVEFIIENGLSKYNRESIGTAYNRFRRRPVVLVVGQVPNDASIRMGNPDNWTSGRLVALAREENPYAEVVYRPHPDVYNRPTYYREDMKAISEIATVLEPSVPFADLLENATKVYTISSLVGFEALLRRIPVVAVGLPFYAGWGLTDDRADHKHPAFARRSRRLTLEQLAAGSLMLYPRYLADLTDPDVGLSVTMLRIVGERKTVRAPLKLPSGDERKEALARVAASVDWPYLLRRETLRELSEEDRKLVLTNLSVPKMFAENRARIYQISMLCLLCGITERWDAVERFIRRARIAVPHDVLNEVLVSLWQLQPHVALLPHFAWLLEENYGTDEARAVLSESARISTKPRDEADDHYADARAAKRTLMGNEEASALLALAQFNFRNRRLDEAFSLCLRLLLNGKFQNEAIGLLMALASLKFDFYSAVAFAEYELAAGLPKNQPRALARIAEDCRFLDPFKPIKFVEAAFGTTSLTPDAVSNIMTLSERVKEWAPDIGYEQALLLAMNLDNARTIAKAQAWIIFERPEKALPILLELLEKEGPTVASLVALSQTYSYLGDFGQARRVIETAIRSFEHVNAYREAMRLAVAMDDIPWGEELIDRVRLRKLDVGEMSFRKILNGARRIHEALLTQREVSAHDAIRHYYPERFVPGDQAETDFPRDRVFFISIFGPGDEIRTAQIYSEIAKDADFGEFTIAADPRLLPMMQRSFPAIRFEPVARVLRHGRLASITEYTRLPGAELRYVLDSFGHDRLMEHEKAILAVDLLAKYRRSYADFGGQTYLKANETARREFAERLPRGRLLVGVNWRSSVSSFSRNEHYLSVEEISPIFELDGVQFVNLQYDECDREVAWVEERFPGKLLNFDDLDQFNDFERVSGLMANLDLVIAPATTVAELAGALGVRTWLLSNSAELDGRKVTEDDPTDIWHNSMRHIEGDVRGDKSSLMKSLLDELRAFVGAQDIAAQ